LSRFVGVLVGVAALVSAVGAVVGRWVGPWAVQLLFDVRPAEDVAGFIVAGIGAAFGSLVLTQILVARGRTGRLAVGWVLALVGAAVTVVVASGSADTRVAIGFLVGQAVALAALTAATISSAEATDVSP
jgi:hypothetical protein